MKKRDIKEVQTRVWSKLRKRYMFNLASKHHLKIVFFDTLNEKPLSYTDLGSPQINDEFLELMSEKYDWVKTLQDYNKLNKLKGSYIKRILERQENGIFYPAFNQHRTDSGRYGSDLQQLPRLGDKEQFSPIVIKYRNQIREVFIARDDHKFVDADYESLEPHIFAHVSNDSAIKAIFNMGWDFYSTIALKAENLKDVSVEDKKAIREQMIAEKMEKEGRLK